MCPFFGKCDGFLIIDPVTARVKFVGNPERKAEIICRAIMSSGARRLICGFVPDRECATLREAGVDVRLGSCACEVDALVTQFNTLPRA
jgi:predicted Fe-Mo cluster-binding NifX family protein